MSEEQKKPSLYIVGADKGGVGKTVLSRTLLDYFKRNAVRPDAYDTEPAPGVLKRFYPYAKSVDLGIMRGQMEVFDGMPRAVVTLVDLKAGILSDVLDKMDKAGLLKDIQDGAMDMIVLHVLGSSEASLREIAATAAILKKGGTHILVKNHSNDGQFFEWDQAAYDSYFGGSSLLLDIPHLDGAACDTIEQAGLSFEAFIGDEKFSKWMRRSVSYWRDLVFAEFDRAKLLPASA